MNAITPPTTTPLTPGEGRLLGLERMTPRERQRVGAGVYGIDVPIVMVDIGFEDAPLLPSELDLPGVIAPPTAY